MLDTICLFHNDDVTALTNPLIYIFFVRIDPMVSLLYDLFDDYFHRDNYIYVCFYSIIVHLLFINTNYLL
jgi:hypothetical protein